MPASVAKFAAAAISGLLLEYVAAPIEAPACNTGDRRLPVKAPKPFPSDLVVSKKSFHKDTIAPSLV